MLFSFATMTRESNSTLVVPSLVILIYHRERQEPKGRQDLLERMELTVLMELMELPVWTVATVPTEKREKQAPLDPPAML